MMKKMAGFFLMLGLVISIYGCADMAAEMSEVPETATEELAEQGQGENEYISAIESENCFVCGENELSLIPYYSKRDSIGIIHWNRSAVSDTEVRAYDDNGKELFDIDGTSMKINSYGDGYGSVWIRGNSNRGISSVSAYYSDADAPDFEKLKDLLCQKCLDKVTEFYNEQMENEEESRIGTTGFALIDFQTKELYRLSDPYRGYMIRDYYIQYDLRENRDDTYIDLTIFYAPERTRKK